MTRTTPRRPPSDGAAAWLCSGALAAGLGLGVTAALVLLLWALTPYADAGLDQALRLAVNLWLLAHGVELLRTATTDGVPAPVGLPPILLTALPVWLLWRAGSSAADPLATQGRPAPLARFATGGPAGLAGWAGGDRRRGHRGWPVGETPPVSPGLVGYAAGWLSAGYLAMAGLAALVAASGPLRLPSPTALLTLALLTVCCTTAAVGYATGGHRDVGHRPALPRAVAVARAVRAGTLTLCGAGALLTVASLVAHAQPAQQLTQQLTDGWSGRLGLLLLSLALLPNAAVWAASYGLGPGFTLGAGALTAPFAPAVADGPLALPLPLLAAVPAGPLTEDNTPWAWAATAAVPVAGAVAVAVSVARSTDPTDRLGGTAWTALCAAVGCGATMALLAAFAGGPLGTEGLAHLGPSWWATGGAALLWTAALGVPGALLLHRVRARQALPPAPDGPDGWYHTAARRRRYAVLKRTSGGLMAEFPPRAPGED